MHGAGEEIDRVSEPRATNEFEWSAARATIPMAVGLSMAAFRASVLPRTWALLMTALVLDNFVSRAIGLDRQRVARAWAVSAAHALPERFQDLFDKAWVGPLGLIAPVLDLLAAKSLGEAAGAVPAIVSTLVIWGLFGGAICRIAMTRMTQQPIPGYFGALRYTLRRAGAVCVPLASMGGLALAMTAFLAILGALTHLPVVGQGLAWITLPAMILPGAILILCVCGVILGGPLILGAALHEEPDTCDVLSRSQCYLFQAPVTWALTIKIGFLVQTVGYYVVRWFLLGLVALMRRGLSLFGALGTGASRVDWKFPDPWTMPAVTSDAFDFWSSVIKLAAVTWPAGFAFAFTGALYLALKARVDLVPPQDVRIE